MTREHFHASRAHAPHRCDGLHSDNADTRRSLLQKACRQFALPMRGNTSRMNEHEESQTLRGAAAARAPVPAPRSITVTSSAGAATSPAHGTASDCSNHRTVDASSEEENRRAAMLVPASVHQPQACCALTGRPAAVVGVRIRRETWRSASSMGPAHAAAAEHARARAP